MFNNPARIDAHVVGHEVDDVLQTGLAHRVRGAEPLEHPRFGEREAERVERPEHDQEEDDREKPGSDAPVARDHAITRA